MTSWWFKVVFLAIKFCSKTSFHQKYVPGFFPRYIPTEWTGESFDETFRVAKYVRICFFQGLVCCCGIFLRSFLSERLFVRLVQKMGSRVEYQGCRFAPCTCSETKPQMGHGSKYWFPGFGFDSGPNLQPWNWRSATSCVAACETTLKCLPLWV